MSHGHFPKCDRLQGDGRPRKFSFQRGRGPGFGRDMKHVKKLGKNEAMYLEMADNAVGESAVIRKD